MKKKHLIALLLLTFFVSRSQTIDDTFQQGINGFDANSITKKTIIQPDGKILILGGTTALNYNVVTGFGKLMRINSDGTFDSVFMNNIGTGFDRADYIELLPDGKILVAVGAECIPYLNGASTQHLVRLNSDGTRDYTFNLNFTGLNFENTYKYPTYHPNGKIYVIHKTNRLIRLNYNGTIDTSFSAKIIDHIGTFPNFPNIYFIKIDADGKLLIGGQINSYNGNSINNLIRINEDGSIDNTFNLPFNCSGNNQFVYSIAFLNNSKILVSGKIPSTSGTIQGNILRLNNDWTIDNSFNYFDVSTTKTPKRLIIQPDDKILVSGNSYSSSNGYTPYFVRLESDGSFSDLNLSNIFKKNYNNNTDTFIEDILLQDDGKIIVTGNFNYFGYQTKRKILRLNNNVLSTTEFNVNDIFIFPNPVEDILTIDFNENINKIEIYDYLGRLIIDKKIHNNKIDLSEISKGNYAIKLYSEEKVISKKFIKK